MGEASKSWPGQIARVQEDSRSPFEKISSNSLGFELTFLPSPTREP